LYELISIPLIEYAGVFVLAGLFGAGLWVFRKVNPQLMLQTDQG
jgi:hypothetical protein